MCSYLISCYPPSDPSLTCSSVLAALETVNDVTNGYNAYKKLENCLSIEFEAWKMKMRKQYSSVIEYRKDLVNYWLKYHPNASWKYLAGELLYTECNQALEEVKRNIPRPINGMNILFGVIVNKCLYYIYIVCYEPKRCTIVNRKSKELYKQHTFIHSMAITNFFISYLFLANSL